MTQDCSILIKYRKKEPLKKAQNNTIANGAFRDKGEKECKEGRGRGQ